MVSSIDWALAAGLGNLALSNSPNAINANGNNLNNILLGNSYANTLNGYGGNDTLYGYGGADTLIGGQGDDTYCLMSGYKYDLSTSSTFSNISNVFNRSNLLNGNNYGTSGPIQEDTIVEQANEGIDTVYSAFDYTLGDNLENLVLCSYKDNSTGYLFTNYAIAGSGNELNNVITGNAGNNVIAGAAGDDSLIGDAGNDSLNGGDGNDTLNGGTGNDVLIGGAGNDVYLFNRLDGQDTIDNFDSTAGTVDTIRFGTGIAASDITIKWNGSDLVLGNVNTTDQLTILNWGLGTDYQIERVEFADGTVWDAAALSVMTVNHAPVATGVIANQSLQQDQSFNLNVSSQFSDDNIAHGDVLTFSATQTNGSALPAWLTFNAATQTFSGSPGNADVGSLNLRVSATDTGGLTASSNFTIDIANVNDAPILAKSQVGQVAPQDTLFSYTLPQGTFADPDSIYGDVLTYTATLANGSALPGWLTFNAATQTFSGTPTSVDMGSIDLIVTATDNGGLSANSNFTLSVYSPVVNGTDGNDIITGSAFDETLNGLAGNDVLSGGAGNDVLDGGTGDDTLDGGAGNDLLLGGDGSDTFVFGVGSGQDTIEFDLFRGGDVVQMGSNLLSSDVYAMRSAQNPDDLVVTINGTTDTLTIQNYFSNPLSAIRFADGTTWNSANIRITDLVLDGTAGADTLTAPQDGTYDYTTGTYTPVNTYLNGGAGNDYLIGGTGNDVLNGGAGNDILVGNYGADTYLFGVGSGQDVMWNAGIRMEDVVEVGVGMVDVSATRVDHDLVLSINGTTDTLTISGYFYSPVSEIRFTDGTKWTPATVPLPVDDYVYGTDGNDYLLGGYGNDILVGGLGNDTLNGGTGNDTYFFNVGDGADIIQDGTEGGTNINTLVLGAGITLNMVTPIVDIYGMVTLDFGYGDSVCINQMGNFSVQSIQFADGSVVSIESLFNAPPVASPDAFSMTEDDGVMNIAVAALLANDTDPNANDTLSMVGYDAITANGNVVTQDVAGDLVLNIGNNYQSLAAGQTATDSFSYTISDSKGATSSATVNITINGLNDAPVVATALAAQSVAQGQAFSFALPANSFTDVDAGDVLTYTATQTGGAALPGWLTFDAATQTFSGTPGVGSLANLSIVVIATDTGGLSATSDFTLAINSPVFTGTSGDDNLTGTIYDDTLNGLAGNDTLNGGAGKDTMNGGLGDDTYVVDNTSDVVVELASAGTDTVQSSVTYTLAANVENLTLTGTAAINGTGNTLDNVLDGSQNIAANVLTGGTGNDTYILGTGDTIVEAASAGTDTVMTAATYTLGTNLENLTLTGTAAINGTGNTVANILTGNSAANTLSGGTGADTMIGGAGNDTYVVDNVGDIVTELLNEGSDLVQSSVTYTLSANVENLMLTGTTAINGTGNAGDNVLTGNTGVNTLTGGAGNDTLNGGTGADKLLGGLGNDTYVVDNTGDVITENLNEGIDLVQSSVTYTLATNVENLTLTGTTAINGTGNALDNVLDGSVNTKANVLTGGAGNDTYVLGTGDTIVEAAAAGIDTVMSVATYTLAANLENLTLTGTAAINGTGNTVDNILLGNSSANTLSGGAGNDMLFGDLGNDTINGDAGNDILQGGAGNDSLTDTAGNNLLDGGADADTLTGNTGNEIYIGGIGNDIINTGNGTNIIAFNKGDGLDTVNGVAGTSNTISLGGNFAFADMALQKNGNDLILDVGSADSITLKNWYTGTKNIVTLQVVETAMSDFNPGSTDVLRNSNVETFNFQQMVTAFDQALAANPTITSWGMTNALLTAHLSSSDAAALGGDLAYEYGARGNLTGFGVTAAISSLSNAQFATAPQTLNPWPTLNTGTAQIR